ncbi:hypothetical protein [Micromonospora sp. NPDC050276]
MSARPDSIRCRTPEQAGTHTLTARTVLVDGTVSPERAYTFVVNDTPAP